MAVIFGIDQSTRPPPTAGALTGAGVKFCNHYVADRWTSPVVLDDPSTWPPKCLRPAEAGAYVAAGVQLLTNWETSADAMKAGYDRGQSAAANAARMAGLCGAPDDMVVFFSADWDATYDDYTGGIAPFLRGAHAKLGTNRAGRRRTALYGGLYPITWAFRDGLIDYGWQTAAWSGDPPTWHPRAQLRQYPDAPRAYHVTIGGVTCDINHALADEFGQWGATSQPEVDMTDNQAKQLAAVYNTLTNATAGSGTILERVSNTDEILAGVTAALGKLDQIKAAVTTGQPVTLTQAQLDEVKAALQALEGSALVQLAVSPKP